MEEHRFWSQGQICDWILWLQASDFNDWVSVVSLENGNNKAPLTRLLQRFREQVLVWRQLWLGVPVLSDAKLRMPLPLTQQFYFRIYQDLSHRSILWIYPIYPMGLSRFMWEDADWSITSNTKTLGSTQMPNVGELVLSIVAGPTKKQHAAVGRRHASLCAYRKLSTIY